MSKKIDMVGKRFGRLFVESEDGRNKYGEKMYLCKCDCGNAKMVRSHALISGETRSCGCLQKEMVRKSNTIHGDTNSSLYRRYKHMIWRCKNSNCKDYKNYGGRGIRVCDEWEKDYRNFQKWSLENGYREDLTIDRIDVNGNYEPNNCRWITLQEQENNRRDSVYLSFNGITKTASQWSRLLRIRPNKIYYLKRKGLSDENVLMHFPQIAEVLKQLQEGEE